MPYVNTTFLPKTNGLVFADRLSARSIKGRVFGLDDTPIPPDAQLLVDAPASLAVAANVRNTITVVASGHYTVSYVWQIRKADDSGWITANATNLAAQYPDAVFSLFDTQGGILNFIWVQGSSFPKLRCRIRDTDSEGAYDQVNSRTTTITYS